MVQMSPLVSIIVPVFNVEDYLEECLQSLLNQSLRQIEIIAVDDGSTDKSSEILERYASLDNRLIVIIQNNQGQAGARNSGLAVASGTYIGFVDPDDWVAETMFEILYSSAMGNNADLSVCDYSRVNGIRVDSHTLKLSDEVIRMADHKLEEIWLKKKYSVVVWNKLYKKTILDTFSIRFEAGHEVFSEDVLFNLYYLMRVKIMTSVEGSYYYYRLREGSLTSSVKPNYLKKELTLVDKFREYYAGYPNVETVNKILFNLLFDRVIDNCLHKLDVNDGLKNIHKDLIYATQHEYFHRSMSAAWKDSSLWMPLRGFAYLNASRQYVLSVCYLYGYHKATMAKKYIKKYI